MIMNAKVIALAAAVFALEASATFANSLDVEAKAIFEPVMKQFDVPGIAIGVTRDGKHSFYTSGLASRADNRAVTPDTIFELGSISKIFTATLAALAEDQGRLKLTDRVSGHLCPDGCTIGNNMTLMDLATHRSGGLPLQVPDEIKDVKELVEWLKDWQPKQPGMRSYSNISIGMLGYISGMAMGMDYKQAAQSVLFPSFGLEHTWIEVPQSEAEKYAFGYDRKTNKPIRVTPGVLDSEAYGVKSTARDMLKVLDVELGKGEASDSLRRAVARTQEGQQKNAFFTQDMIWEQYAWPADLQAMTSGNGYDFILKPQPTEDIRPPLAPQKDVILNKTGSTNGFGGYVAFVPSEKIGVVILANKNFPNDARVKATLSLIKAMTAD